MNTHRSGFYNLSLIPLILMDVILGFGYAALPLDMGLARLALADFQLVMIVLTFGVAIMSFIREF